MGDSLKTVHTTKITHAGSIKQEVGGDIQFGVSSCQGRRQTQEDAHAIEVELRLLDDGIGSNSSLDSRRLLPGHALFAIFDGHGTGFASKFTASHLVSTFCKQSSFIEYSQKFLMDSERQRNPTVKKKGQHIKDDKDTELKSLLANAIKSTMIELDAIILHELSEGHNYQCGETELSHYDGREMYDQFDTGTTAIIVVLAPQYIVCANLGDSRAILQRSSSDGVSVISLSNDHKPNNDEELLRIQNAGGEVIRGLIEGRLAVSRGLGDFAFKHTPSVLCALEKIDSCSNIDDYVLPEKQMVTPVPEITFHCREPALDHFIAIACDGIWDVLSNEKCAEIISAIFNEGEESTALVCEEVLDQCYAKGSLDNMTIILIKFPAQTIGVGGGVMKRRKQRIKTG